MILDIKPINNRSYDCFQDVAASIAAYWGKEHFMMFTGSWFFDYIEDAVDMTFGERISVGWRVVDFEALGKYHGIRFNYYNKATLKDTVDLIKYNISVGIPVILQISSYCCPWLNSYLKYGIEHYCLAVGYEDNGSSIFCIDSYMANGVVKLPFSEMEKGVAGCLTCKMTEEGCLDLEWRYLLKKAVTDMELPGGSTARSNRIRKFACGIGEGLDFALEKQGFIHDFAVPLYRYLKDIENSRTNFAYFLSCLSYKYNNGLLSGFSKEMHEAGVLWYRQRLNIIKAAASPKGSGAMRSISKKIMEIADYEEMLADRIIRKML